MSATLSYGHLREVDLSVDDAIEKVTAALGDRGFGVLTTIDVKATLKKKLDEDRPPYVILGACNPNFASQSLKIEENLGLLLPCNVVVYENEAGRTVVGSIDAGSMLGIVGNESLEPVAEQVNSLLREAVDSI